MVPLTDAQLQVAWGMLGTDGQEEAAGSAAPSPPPVLVSGAQYSGLQYLFAVPFWRADLQLGTALTELAEIVLRRWEAVASELDGDPEETSNSFFWQQTKSDIAWRDVRDACLERRRTGQVGLAPQEDGVG